jgi:GT2 family glycosyltransferase
MHAQSHVTPEPVMVRSTHMTALPGWRVEAGEREARPENGTLLENCSLVIATYERPTELMRLLRALEAIADPPAEVVIVDGHPDSECSRQLRWWADSTALPFDCVYVESPPGLTRQRNAGVDISTRRYVFFLDDDAVPLPGYFLEMARVFENDRLMRIGGIAGCPMNEVGRPLVGRWRLRVALGIVPRLDPMSYDPTGTSVPHSLLQPFSGVRRIDAMPGCGFTLRREVFETERFSCFFQGYSQGEDLEMSLRVGRRWELVCCGDARLLHLAAKHGRPASYKRGRMDMRNRYFIWRRYTPRPGARLIARFWLDVAFVASMDAAWFCCRPWKPEPLGHAAGLLMEGLRSLVRPPRFEEPAARREYMPAAGETTNG